MNTDEPPRARTLRFCPTPYQATALVKSRPMGARVLLHDLYEDAHQAGWGWLRCTIRDLADRYELKKHVVESLLDDLERAGLLEREIVTAGGRSIGTRFRLFDPLSLAWDEALARAAPVDRRTSKPAATAHSGGTAGHDRRSGDRTNRPDITRTSPRTSEPRTTAHNGAVAGHAAGHRPDACDRSNDRTIDPPPKPPAAPRSGGSPADAQLRGVIAATERAEQRDVRVAWAARLVPELLDELPDDERALVAALERRADWLGLALLHVAKPKSTAQSRLWKLGLEPETRALADRAIHVLWGLIRRKDVHGIPIHRPPDGLRTGPIGQGFGPGLEIWRARPPDFVPVPIVRSRLESPPTPPPDEPIDDLDRLVERARELGVVDG